MQKQPYEAAERSRQAKSAHESAVAPAAERGSRICSVQGGGTRNVAVTAAGQYCKVGRTGRRPARVAPRVTGRAGPAGSAAPREMALDRQQEFVLRTLEERDIRFIRLWFTDVLGLPQVGGRRPRRAGGRVRRGHRLRRVGDRGLRARVRVRHARQARTRPRSRCCRGGRSRPASAGCSATSSCRTARRRYADPRYVLKRALARAADLGFTFYTHPEIEFFLLKDKPERRPRARAGRRGGLLRPHPAQRRATTSAATRSRCWSRWASRWSSATTRARPASRRSTCATPTR